MLIALSGVNGQATADATVSRVEWCLPVARQIGVLSARLERGHPLLGVLNRDGGDWLRAAHPMLGTWTGITLPPGEDGTGAVALEAQGIEAVAAWRVVSASRELVNLTAGAIARLAVADALAGTTYLRAGTFVEAPPLVTRYSFAAQTLAEVLNGLSEATGQEWAISASGALNWTPPGGAAVTGVLTEGGDLVDVRRELAGEVVAGVTARGTGGLTYTAVAEERTGALLGQQVGISVAAADPTGVALAAEAELARRRGRAVTLTAKLGPAWWGSVREGDRATVLLPAGRYTGEALTARVTARRWADGAEYLDLTLSVLPPFAATPVKRLGARATEPGVNVVAPVWGRRWREPLAGAVATTG